MLKLYFLTGGDLQCETMAFQQSFGFKMIRGLPIMLDFTNKACCLAEE